MKLNHFTQPKNLDSIAEAGLLPRVAHNPFMSLGQEVVWLTTQETTMCSEEELGHFRKIGEDLYEAAKRDGWFLTQSRNHRLTVRVRSGHKLINYGDLLRLNKDAVLIDEDGMGGINDAGEIYSVRHMLESLSLTCLRSWWLYFGRIPPSAIEGLPQIKGPKEKPRARNPVLDLALAKARGGGKQWRAA
jgi:hypothetical protein